MTIKEDIHTLAQDIVAAYDTRLAGFASIRQEVTGQREASRVFVHDLDRAHRARSHQLHTDLRREEGRRKAQVHGVMKGLATAHAEAQGEWRGLGATMRTRRGGGTTEAPTPRQHSTRRGSRGGDST